MKLFNVFLIFSFFFFISCGDGGVTRVVEEENHETVNDNDPTNPTDDPTNPTDDPTNPTDDPTDDPTNPTDDPTNPTDDPTNPTDDPTNPTDDPTNPTDDPTNPTDDPTNPTDDPTNPTDDPTNPTDDPTNPTDPTVEPDSDQVRCVAAGGTWDDFADNYTKICYKIVDCALPAGENAEYIVWREAQSYTLYYDFESKTWTGETYSSEYNDSGEAEVCQYICASNAERDYEAGVCRPYCSAVFNGESSRIEVADNDLLNPGSDSWTIEAWIKQDEGDLTSDYAPILRKGTSENPSYVLMGYRKQQSWSSDTYTVTGATTYKSAYGSTTENLQVDGTFNEFSGGWTHVALVHNKKVEGNIIQSITYKITLYVNGKQVNSKTYEPRTTMNLLEVNEPLIIGANLYTSWTVSKKYFKGLIDSIRISGSERYTADFTPSQLSVDNDTIAFWDFNNNFDDTSVNGLASTPTNVTFSTDCAF